MTSCGFYLSIILFMLIVNGVSGNALGQFNVTVDLKPGSANYTTINEAIAAAPNRSAVRYAIRIRRGVYREYITIPPHKTNIMLVGDGVHQTFIKGNKSASPDLHTYETATVGVEGEGFAAVDITFENDAGQGSQAVALRNDANRSAFYRCQFLGYQDTLYARRNWQFYRDCIISGTVDFIFGNAQVVFQNCKIYARKPLGNVITITAQGREDPKGIEGTVIHNCSIKAAADLLNHSLVKTYLGRPWQIASRVIIMQSYLDDLIDPRGWLEWQGQKNDILFYAEYRNWGPRNSTTTRVKWPGFKALNYSQEANPFTVRNFIKGNEWIPEGIPFNLDLIQE